MAAAAEHSSEDTGHDGSERLRLAFGVAAIGVTFGGIVAAIALAPWFSLTGNALSDLGEIGRSTAPLFNLSLLAGGALGSAFVVTIWPDTDDPHRRGALVVLFVAMVCMALVGAFPLPTAPHGLVAISFFLTMTVGVLVWGLADMDGGRPARGGVLVVGVALHVVSWLWWGLFGWPGEGIAVPELVGSATLATWALWVATEPFRG